MKLLLRDREINLTEPLIMGILNITPDSFSDGGKFLKKQAALKRVEQMLEEGADIIDVGGESTRPGADKVSEEEECRRILPVIHEVKKRFNPILSIDTYKASIAQRAVEEAGADIINDISALRFSAPMADLIARLKVPVILMHMQGEPGNMQKNPRYTDTVGEIISFLKERISFARERGIVREKICVDPGIGFGKRYQDNIQIIREFKRFKELKLPLLMGLSRKRFIADITGEKIEERRGTETITANLISVLNGASILRVHDVQAAKRSLLTLKAILG